MSNKSVPQSPALIWTGAERPRIQPGEYTARCTGFQGPEWIIQFGRWGLRLEFTLDPDNERISAFYSFGEDRNAPKIGARSKYYKDWVRANGGPPQYGQDISAALFVNPELAFTVQVNDATKDSENAAKHPALVYSLIEKILDVKHLSADAYMQESW